MHAVARAAEAARDRYSPHVLRRGLTESSHVEIDQEMASEVFVLAKLHQQLGAREDAVA